MIHQPSWSLLINSTGCSWFNKVNESNVYRAHTVNGFQFWVKCDFVGMAPFFFVSSSLELFNSTPFKLPFFDFFLFLLFDALFNGGFSFDLAFPIPLSVSKLQVTGEGPINPCNHKLNCVLLLWGNYSCANWIAWGGLSRFKQIQGKWTFQKY